MLGPASVLLKIIALYHFQFYLTTTLFVGGIPPHSHSNTLDTDSHLFDGLADLSEEDLRPSKRAKNLEHTTQPFPEYSNKDYSCSSDFAGMMWPEMDLQYFHDILAPSPSRSYFKNAYNEGDIHYISNNMVSNWGDGEAWHVNPENDPKIKPLFSHISNGFKEKG
ncbi:hypothetical protein PGT21_013799 [Puccinia graminis f. sp. tritici]|uniref:Uncharacterized protein n=1 Tax=Puccinia graminis f. sp. tritici TaxID=56615 RepID=A0A5B0LNF6_PUCGR|nr:hypothetical protein PGTUg99_010576 [Puccinia graminis f. sp. tritici]KAA1090786.1 hypothetical protein PGT21_013799 [Puccinia graminis f. sp. tritici]